MADFCQEYVMLEAAAIKRNSGAAVRLIQIKPPVSAVEIYV
jgi:hypothetical protein